jgi:hypothetical protein
MAAMPGTEALLHELLAAAGLPEATSFEVLTGHGFNHTVLRAALADGRQVVLRHQQDEPRPLPFGSGFPRD